MVAGPKAGDLLFELVLKGQAPRRALTRFLDLDADTRRQSRQACVLTGPASRISTFHAVEFSKTGAALVA
jgi:hypothetical protein